MEQRLILASKSPRRHELLSILGIPFDRLAPKVDESPRPHEGPGEMVMRLSLDKARDVLLEKKGLVIAADTAVFINGRVLGKPKDEEDASNMLSLLSGAVHEVYTGLALSDGKKEICEVERTNVCFRPLSKEEIACYIKSKEPMDKAGAYGIQGLGALFVKGIEGDYFNVVGLPLCLLGRILARDFGIDPLACSPPR